MKLSRARQIEDRLKKGKNPTRAALLQRFFQTGKGQYGEGDRFLGYTVPAIRRLGREYRDLTREEADALLRSPWHEVRLLALVILTEQARSMKTVAERESIAEWVLGHGEGINNWDLVDVSIPVLLGSVPPTLAWQARYRALLHSTRLWDRRMGILATFGWIRQGVLAPCLQFAEVLLEDHADLMHKAVGWMLREVGKRDEVALRRFLDHHAAVMPRTMLRYAIERLPPFDRATYMKAKSFSRVAL